MPRGTWSSGCRWRFALADLLQTALLEGDVGRAAADWPELWEDATSATGWTRWLIRGRLAVARAEIALLAGTARGGGRVGVRTPSSSRSQTRRAKYEAQARSLLGRALVRLDRRVEGIAELRRAVDIADRLVNPAGRWHAHAALADGLRRNGGRGRRGVRDARQRARS